jgi:hypothetical protein
VIELLASMAHKLPAATLLAAFAVLLLALAAAPLVVVVAGDPDMLQDICVADYHSLKGRKFSIDLYFHYNVLMRDSQ